MNWHYYKKMMVSKPSQPTKQPGWPFLSSDVSNNDVELTIYKVEGGVRV